MVQSSQEWLPGMIGTLTNMCQVPIELLPTRTRLQTSGKHGGYWRWVSLILGSVSQRRRRAKTTTSFILLGCWQTNTNTRSIYLNHSNHSKHSTLCDERCGWVILPRLRWYRDLVWAAWGNPPATVRNLWQVALIQSAVILKRCDVNVNMNKELRHAVKHIKCLKAKKESTQVLIKKLIYHIH